jgi:pimeloyl-ACP methyl ester carboxylesterase
MGETTVVEPFSLQVDEATLDDLRDRLRRARLPDEVPGSSWRLGTNRRFVDELVTYWANDFDWRAHEAALNSFDNYRARVDGIDLHWIHAKGVGPSPTPLLLVHGWPGSVWEFHELIPRLTDPARYGGDPNDAFTIVAPSLPGFTLSFEPNQRRFDIAAIADTLARLMSEVLGYERFVAQGGDWGGYVVARLAASYPEMLAAIHLNFLPLRQDIPFPDQTTAEDLAYQEELRIWQTEETGYHAIQGTKPQTLAYALTDSPVGLAAWIVEKFQTWTDHRGDFAGWVDRDDLLTNVMLYWTTGAINSSFWPYYAIRHDPWPLPAERIDTPTAYASFPRETRHPPRHLADLALNIQRWTEMPRGGHFAALEVPDLLAGDVIEYFRSFRPL